MLTLDELVWVARNAALAFVAGGFWQSLRSGVRRC